MSNASSPTSSFVESANGSLGHHRHGSNSSLGDSPNASGTNVDGHEEHQDIGNTEPMFNFRRLAETIGEEDVEDKVEASKHVEYLGGEASHDLTTSLFNSNDEAAKEDENMEQSVATVRPGDNDQSTPEVMVTPVSPAAESANDSSRQLGHGIYETVEA